MLLAMGLGVLIMLVQSADRLAPASHSVSSMSPKTADALKLAKEALIGYAATSGDRNSSTAFGYLPMPDMGGQVDTVHHPGGINLEGVAAGGFPSNNHDETAIGRLPWNTLGIPALKDEYGECLWYAVSGSFKNTSPNSTIMNWDSIGYLDVRGGDGTGSLWGVDIHSRPVALIFSAGPPLPNQNRSNSTEAGDNVYTCHGNYDVRNYLDPFAATADTNNITNWLSTDTTTGHHALDSVASVVRQFLGNPLTGTGTQTLNDRAITITPADIFKQVKQRSYYRDAAHVGYINDILQRMAQDSCLQAPYHVPNHPSNGGTNLNRGHRPSNCHFNDPGQHDIKAFADNWDLHLYYMVCVSGTACLTLNLTEPPPAAPSHASCTAVLVFAGEAAAGRNRDNSLALGNEDPADYLEGSVLQAYQFDTTTTLDGNHYYMSSGPASADVIVCLP
jgi:hypothetical protein